MQEDITQRIGHYLDTLFENSMFFLVDIKMPTPNKIQVFVDGDKGIQIDKCAEISRKLEAFLEENKLVGEKYTLEVSSPGMSNPLKVLRQYQRRVGSNLEILKNDGVMITGKLMQVDEVKIELKEERKIKKSKQTETIFHTIQFGDIKRTKLVF